MITVDERAELERPRNPTPTAALTAASADLCDPVADFDTPSSSGAIPKTGGKYDRRRRERTRHVSAGKLLNVISVVLKGWEDRNYAEATSSIIILIIVSLIERFPQIFSANMDFNNYFHIPLVR